MFATALCDCCLRLLFLRLLCATAVCNSPQGSYMTAVMADVCDCSLRLLSATAVSATAVCDWCLRLPTGLLLSTSSSPAELLQGPHRAPTELKAPAGLLQSSYLAPTGPGSCAVCGCLLGSYRAPAGLLRCLRLLFATAVRGCCS
jgi:hypothetical protein